MPEGRITSYDVDEAAGQITPAGEDETLAFDRDDVADYQTGEQLRSGQHVTFTVAEGCATDVRRVAPRGYGA
jgi:cold shock CspA family protein